MNSLYTLAVDDKFVSYGPAKMIFSLYASLIKEGKNATVGRTYQRIVDIRTINPRMVHKISPYELRREFI